ncbi:MAG: RDD family protein [Actinomycetia bacterium]|nr:RDD family protein [Actinomycetes bacterium]
MKRAGHGQAISQQGHYAGAVSRLAAFVLDQTVATAAFSLGTAAVAWSVSLVTNHEFDVELTGILSLIAYSIWLFLYYSYPWAMSGKTLGMAVLGIRVVTAEGASIGGRTAATRTIALPLTFLTLGIGFLPILFGRDRRAMHDHIAGTAVVYAWDARAARWRFLAQRSSEEPADDAVATH